MNHLGCASLIAMVSVASVSALAQERGTVAPCRQPGWTTVDQFLPDHAELGAAAGAVLATDTDTYVVGTARESESTRRWVVRKSKARGAWRTVDDHFDSLGFAAHPESVVRLANGAIVVIGGVNDPSNAGKWLVRGSADGEQFSSLAELRYDENNSSGYARAAVRAPDAVLWAGGHGADAQSNYHWLVLRSVDGGVTWTADDDVEPRQTSAGVQALVVDRRRAVFAAGHDYDGQQWRWRVRRRDGLTGTWADSDDFVLSNAPPTYTSGAIPLALVSAGRNTVLAAGSAVDDDGLMHWIVRRTTNAGLSWATVEDMGPGCHARAAAYNEAARQVFVVGRCWDGDAYHWVTRMSHNGGASWNTDDDFVLAAGNDSYASGVGSSPNGDVVAAGMGRDADGTPRWIVRRRSCGR